MCGINGIIQFKHLLGRQELYSKVHQMNDEIVHRGPDDEGIFADDTCAIGMRRLSIIDLQHGFQPIWNKDHSIMIVFNGEIYNYRDIRKELLDKGYYFSTNSDTEVILVGYEAYGPLILEKLEGMFAFAIYDLHNKKWVFARDRIGEKPFYYYSDKTHFIFSSELKGILSTGYIKKSINKKALSQYLQLTYIPSPLTIIEDVNKLPAGCYMELDERGNYSIKEYWNLSKSNILSETKTYSEYKKMLRDALISSVEKRMVSDVPIGAFLSGGFDSSIVVSIMSMLAPEKVNTFNVAFDDKTYDESELASLVAKKNGTNHIILKLKEEEVLSDIPTILHNMDEPFADSSIIAVHAISKMARNYVKVVLTGDGGDELFAGYNKYLIPYYGNLYKKIPRPIRKTLLEKGVNLLPSKSYKTQGIRKLISAVELDDIDQCRYMMSLGYKKNELLELAKGIETETLDFIADEYVYLSDADSQTRTQYVDLKTVLEGDMLAKVDRGSMLASLETRVPMLDTKVVELAFQIPTRFKINGKNRKIILKDAFSDLLPEQLYHAPKHGFGVPVSDWLETSLKEKLLFYSNKELLEAQGIFNAGIIESMINEHMCHKIDRFSALWCFFVFQNWYERLLGF